ncbi:hypothetical protein [Streptomyces phaeolivaceus]|uniref:hypothetical protein n=1 Tax=Streptomyces phaeolivaceus TaxID=2653200 RepID=UPI001869D15E|nr:hypothetical protein [Streptomyces phaeolivaceus]
MQAVAPTATTTNTAAARLRPTEPYPTRSLPSPYVGRRPRGYGAAAEVSGE